MARSLRDLVLHCKRLVALAGATHDSFLLPLLLGLTPKEISQFDVAGHLSDDEMASIAARLSVYPDAVKVVLTKNVFDDLKDYHDSYKRKKAVYAASGASEAYLAELLRRHDPEISKIFVLHDVLNTWCAEADSLDELFIDNIQTGELDEHLAQGYLISSGLAYLTTFDVMEASYREQWPNWEALWGHF
jgi:hypothetical protein